MRKHQALSEGPGSAGDGASEVQRARTLRWAAHAALAAFLGVAAYAMASDAAAFALRERAERVSRGADEREVEVKLTEVATRVEAASGALPNATELLRRETEAQLAAIDWAQHGVRGRYTLSAALVRLESVRSERNLLVSCTVSTTLRDAKRGTLLAVVDGRARAEEDATRGGADRAQRGALAGAVRGAITALPDAMRRLR